MPTTSTTSTTSAVATTGGVAGVVAGLASVVDGLLTSGTGHSFNIAEVVRLLGGSGLTLGSVLGLVFHANSKVRHDALVAVADAQTIVKTPEFTELRGDLDVTKASVAQLLDDVAPGVVADLTSEVAKVKSDIGGLAATVESRVGVTSAQVDQAIEGRLHEVFPTLVAPPVAVVTAGQAGATMPTPPIDLPPTTAPETVTAAPPANDALPAQNSAATPAV